MDNDDEYSPVDSLSTSSLYKSYNVFHRITTTSNSQSSNQNMSREENDSELDFESQLVDNTSINNIEESDMSNAVSSPIPIPSRTILSQSIVHRIAKNFAFTNKIVPIFTERSLGDPREPFHFIME